jgi:serine/threonine-protein kinase
LAGDGDLEAKKMLECSWHAKRRESMLSVKSISYKGPYPSEFVLEVARRWLVVTAIFVATLCPKVAQGQTTTADKATAEALFDEGLQLLKQEKVAEACKRFEASQRVEPAVGTLLYLGECYERTERFASAWATFREAASAAAASGQIERSNVASKRAKAIEPRLAFVTLKATGTKKPAGLTVTRDGEAIPEEALGVVLPINQGEHVFGAEAPGFESWSLRVTVAEKSSRVIEIPELTPKSVPPPPVPEATHPKETAPPAAAPAPQADHGPPTLAWVSAGVGLVGIGVGVGFGLDAKKKDDDASNYCEGKLCFDTKGESLSKSARRSALISNIGYGVGAVGALTCVGLLLWGSDGGEPAADSKSTHASTLRWLPEVTAEAVHMTVEGDF